MEIDNLSPNTYNSDNDNIKVIFAVRLAMLYGSIGNILSNTNASPKCYTGGESSKKKNSIEIIQKPCKCAYGQSVCESQMSRLETSHKEIQLTDTC